MEEAAAPEDYDFKTGGGTGEAEAMDLVKPLPETIPQGPSSYPSWIHQKFMAYTLQNFRFMALGLPPSTPKKQSDGEPVATDQITLFLGWQPW